MGVFPILMIFSRSYHKRLSPIRLGDMYLRAAYLRHGVINVKATFYGIVSHTSAPQCRKMRSRAESLADVAGKRPYVGAF